MNLVHIDLELTKTAHNFEEMGNYFYIKAHRNHKTKYFKKDLNLAVQNDEKAKAILMELFSLPFELTVYKIKFKKEYSTNYVFDKSTLSYLLETYGLAKVKTFDLDVSDVFEEKDFNVKFSESDYYETRLNENVVNNKGKFKTRFFNRRL